MKASKPTLADLRQLRAQAAAETTPAPAPRSRKPRGQRPGKLRAQSAARAAGPNSAAVPEAPKPPPLDATDHALFEHAMQYVQPLARHGSRARAAVRRDPEALLRMRRTHAQGMDARKEAPAPRRHRREPTAVDPEAREFLQPGCGTDLLRDLRRGKWVPEAILDLHGSSEEQAHERLDRFVMTCVEHDIRCVRIVHGKGMGSHGTPVLKTAARVHLCRLEAVQAWVECAEADGGAGAVTALLRKPAHA